jgi:hypothetical protein
VEITTQWTSIMFFFLFFRYNLAIIKVKKIIYFTLFIECELNVLWKRKSIIQTKKHFIRNFMPATMYVELDGFLSSLMRIFFLWLKFHLNLFNFYHFDFAYPSNNHRTEPQNNVQSFKNCDRKWAESFCVFPV